MATLVNGRVLHERYRIERHLGTGSEGSVYLCSDQRVGGHPRALKRVSVVDDQVRATARLMASLRHPSLPLFSDHFEESGAYYLVMDYVQGEPLDEIILKHGPLKPFEACKLGLAVCRALEYLHSCETPILFRDLKPANIIRVNQDELKVVDFGLASPADRRGPHAGSVGYAAPEQWDDQLPDTERTDLFSLGRTLQFVLTGSHPKPNYHEKVDLSHLPSGLSRLVRDLTQLETEKRPQTAAEVSRRLAHLLEGLAPRKRLEAPIRGPGRKRELAVMMLATVLFLFANLYGLDRPPHAPLERGQYFLERGRYQEAASVLSDWVNTNPQDVRAQALRQNALALLTGKPTQRLPVMVPLSGEDQEQGEQILAGAVLAQETWNQSSHPTLFVLELLDNGSDPETTVELAQKAARNEEFIALLGPYESANALLLPPELNRSHLVVLAPTASDPRVFEASSYLFSSADTNSTRIEVILEHLFEQGSREAGLSLAEDLTLSSTMASIIRRRWKQMGGTVLAEISYNQDQTPLMGAEFVFICDFRPREVNRQAHRLRQLGFKGKLGSQSIAFDPELFAENSASVEGMIVSTYFESNSTRPEVRAFIESCQRTFALSQPSHLVVNSFDASSLLMEQLGRGLDREGLRNHLDSLGRELPPYRGVNGEFAPGSSSTARPAFVVLVGDREFLPQP